MEETAGKTAFVTGGASGIGLGIARAFVNAGMQVVLADRRNDHLQHALEHFSARGLRDRVHGIQVDVTDRTAMSLAAEDTERTFGKLHVLVNNAGVGLEGPLEDATFTDWDFGCGVNLGGVINGLQIFLPRIRAHGAGGYVINTASLAALVVMPTRLAIYAATKAAVLALSESIRADLLTQGIGVTTLCPGPTQSNIQASWENRPERFRMGSGFRDAEEKLARRTASPLWMDPNVVGRRVLNAMKRNDPYVITHGEWRQAAEARFQALLDSMPTDVNPELLTSFRGG